MNTTVGNTDSNSNDTSNKGTSEGSIPTGVILWLWLPLLLYIQTLFNMGKNQRNLLGLSSKDGNKKCYSILEKFLNEDPPAIQEGENNRASLIALDAWKHSDFLCKNYILNGLDNTLYNVYCSKKSVKDLWKSLERKYKTEDVETKKFVVGKFLDYKMVD
ncbi:Uncharacterized protein Adt_42607 [Abeliophyllum distichum]|uniref:Uncharacterized protein n=1 Tax=Abeliophyllum distichum TaxID=126358 RepID=A0ABD1PS56_9LAMI